jgi:hypothetical protein
MGVAVHSSTPDADLSFLHFAGAKPAQERHPTCSRFCRTSSRAGEGHLFNSNSARTVYICDLISSSPRAYRSACCQGHACSLARRNQPWNKAWDEAHELISVLRDFACEVKPTNTASLRGTPISKTVIAHGDESIRRSAVGISSRSRSCRRNNGIAKSNDTVR